MKNAIYYLFMILTITAMACKSTPEAVTMSDGSQMFGAEITKDGAIPYTNVLTSLSDMESAETVKLQGKVEAVCQTKGCWMTLLTDGQEETMMVKFKDYGFFVPKDISGKQVIVEGKAYKETTSVDELRHYAEDEGLSKEEIEAIVDPKEEYKFMADGVIVL